MNVFVKLYLLLDKERIELLKILYYFKLYVNLSLVVSNPEGIKKETNVCLSYINLTSVRDKN